MQMVNQGRAHSQPTSSESGVRLVLASASPRRQKLLSLLGVPFTIVTTDAEETDTSPTPPSIVILAPDCPLPPHHHPTILAWRKVRAVWQEAQADIVLGADTVVALNDTVLNKPKDAAQAKHMLQQLSGKTHTVYTGICMYFRGDNTKLFNVALKLVASDVTFSPLSDEVIATYIATGEPFDKAGGYGVQGEAGAFIQEITGSYTSVVGLPLAPVATLLTVAGIPGVRDPVEAYTSWLNSQGKEPLPCPPTQV